MLSLLLENEELFIKLNEEFKPTIDEQNIDEHINTLKFYYQLSSCGCMVACSSVIKYISRHFSSIDSNNLLSLPLEILHTIISSDELVIESEDSLFSSYRNFLKTEAKIRQTKKNLTLYRSTKKSSSQG
ncbi:hypothetical protein M9Y10_032193 [Tritrichomonas musculus]|uniref:BACK domain-containing protein n=1 Tax=Tritrichomonas musculus TaxID=1915356 RepID=A0ABR2H0D5_9EUKA